MNRYFDEKQFFNSNNRIYEGDFTEVKREKSALQKWAEKWIAILTVWARALSESGALSVIKAVSVAVCLVGFIGIAGAMEQGTLGMGKGLLLGGALLLIEYLCLKGKRRHN